MTPNFKSTGVTISIHVPQSHGSSPEHNASLVPQSETQNQTDHVQTFEDFVNEVTEPTPEPELRRSSRQYTQSPFEWNQVPLAWESHQLSEDTSKPTNLLVVT